MPTTESQMRASIKHAKEKLKRIPLDMKKPDYEDYKEHAKSIGMSLNGFIIVAMKEKKERDIEKKNKEDGSN